MLLSGRSIGNPAILTLLLVIHGAASAQTPDTVPSDTRLPDTAQDVYLDDTALRLVSGLKLARDTARLTIDSYTALIRERMGFEAPALRRNRPWVHGARAIRVRWSREEPDIVHILGARFSQPGLGDGDSEFFDGLRTERFATDPLGDPFMFGFAVFSDDRGEVEAAVHSPLEPDSDRYYQFRSGDTISVQLNDGSTLRAVAVTVIPRYASIRLVSAVMWIDPESFGLARVAYRLAKKIDREFSWHIRRSGRWSPGASMDFGPLDFADNALASGSPATPPTRFDRLVNGVFNNLFPRFEMDISIVVADYGLWEMRHWLPRSVRWKGYVSVAEGVTASGVVPPSVPATIDWTLEIEDIGEHGAHGMPSPVMQAAPALPATVAEALRLWHRQGDSIRGEPGSADPSEIVTITPADRQALATSDLLPPSFWEEDQGVYAAALDAVASELPATATGKGGDRTDAPSPWIFDPPGKTLRLLRYNPVEHVSVGTRLRRDFGWGRAELTTRVGTARPELPDIDLTLLRDRPSHRVLVSFYRALQIGDPGERETDTPAVYMTGDIADFHWSHGAAIRILPPGGERNWLSLRLFAEQDADILTDTRRNRVGAAAAWRPWWGGFGSFGGGGRVSVQGAAGDNPHVRALAEGALMIPLPARVSLGMQAGSARVWGDPAPLDLWRIGTSGRWLRGHSSALRASRIQMARVDLQRPVRFFRFSVFGDWASAGGESFYAIGTGLVFMDGVMRVDVARGLQRGRKGRQDAALRMHLTADTFF